MESSPLLSEAQHSIKYLQREQLRQLKPRMLTVLWGPRSCSSVGVSRGELPGGLEGPSDLALGDIPGSAEQSQPSSRGAHMILPCSSLFQFFCRMSQQPGAWLPQASSVIVPLCPGCSWEGMQARLLEWGMEKWAPPSLRK